MTRLGWSRWSDDQDELVANSIKDGCNQKKDDKWECWWWWPNIGSDDYDQDDAIENNSEDLINVLQNVNLSFGNLEGMSEGEKTTI